jgi:hypothetical protein
MRTPTTDGLHSASKLTRLMSTIQFQKFGGNLVALVFAPLDPSGKSCQLTAMRTMDAPPGKLFRVWKEKLKHLSISKLISRAKSIRTMGVSWV